MSTATSLREPAPDLSEEPLADAAPITLRDIPWSVYVALRDNEANDRVRMVYDQGELTLMTLSPLHERMAEFVGRLIDVWTEEQDIPIVGCASTTFRSKLLKKGLEPDKCYYVQNEARIRRLRKFTARTPSPDLAVEVDVSRLSMVKLPVYAALGVPEVWVLRGNSIRSLQWTGRKYTERPDSAALPGFPLRRVPELFEDQFVKGVTAIAREFRAWVRNRTTAERAADD